MSKRIFILAAGPLPCEPSIQCQTAYGLRSWQLLSFLKNTEKPNVRVLLLTDESHYSEAPKFDEWEKIEIHGQSVEVLRLNKNASGFMKRICLEWRSFEPQAALGINNLPSYILAKLKPKVPFWADLNGWLMGEAQSAAHVHQSNAYLATLWKREKKILQEADHFSVVSQAQAMALTGELATQFRLNSFTDEHSLVSVIPNANELPLKQASEFKLELDESEQKVLFSGSYNTWLNEELLFKGLESAMDQNPHLQFVSTGGKQSGQGNRVLDQFQSRIKKSKHKQRFHFLGWIDKKDLLALYKQVHVAINADRSNTESKFGARNRINEWIRYGLPVLSTLETEVAQELHAANCIQGFRNVKELAEQLQNLKSPRLLQMAESAKAFQAENYSYSKTTRSLRKWLDTPTHAPDFNQKVSGGFFSKLSYRIKKDGVFFLFKYLINKRK